MLAIYTARAIYGSLTRIFKYLNGFKENGFWDFRNFLSNIHN